MTILIVYEDNKAPLFTMQPCMDSEKREGYGMSEVPHAFLECTKNKITMYVYIQTEHSSEHDLYTVGFYAPDGRFEPESDHSTREEAATRVHFLNGGNNEKEIRSIAQDEIESAQDEIESAQDIDEYRKSFLTK